MDRVIRWASAASVIVVAGIAAVISYKHMYHLVLRYGETSWTAALLPVSVDGMLATTRSASASRRPPTRVTRSAAVPPCARYRAPSRPPLGRTPVVQFAMGGVGQLETLSIQGGCRGPRARTRHRATPAGHPPGSSPTTGRSRRPHGRGGAEDRTR
ncbi:DUF2637 domain-containing protein [Actinomadura rubrisoli]|uniref:DUF2637 domain-containing protein n=1 Tax=Actinomadura rubrisoli TaxID=2530368 RepID=A0A4R5C653_9ACTN|nr:DUF2637 domain-containing protein [Actinomadura rubrisoli]